MTWAELKIVTLQKVFAITDGKLRDDDTTQEYLTAMPGAANEALALLSTEGWMRKKTLVIVQDPEEPEQTERDGIIYAPVVGEFDLRKVAPEWYLPDTDVKMPQEWLVEGLSTLILPVRAGRWEIRYLAWPPELTTETDDDYELPIYPELATLMPLYMASQIYKDDDIAMATQYRNEFEVGLEMLRGSLRRLKEKDGRWRNTKGWWDW